MSKTAPCEKCRESEPKDFGPGMDDEDVQEITLLLAEVEIAPGTLTWLCHTCRKEWRALACGHQVYRDNAEAQFKMDFWRAKNGRTGTAVGEKGHKMLRIIGACELAITAFANRFLGREEF